MCYVAGTADYGILYEDVQDFKLFGYADNKWSGYGDNQRSTLRSLFTLRLSIATLSSKKQEITVLSKMEAEFVAVFQ